MVEIPSKTIVIMYGTSEVAKAIARALMHDPDQEIIMLIRSKQGRDSGDIIKAMEVEFEDYASSRFPPKSKHSRVIITENEEWLSKASLVIITAGLSLEKALLDPTLALEIKRLENSGKNPRKVLAKENLKIAFEVAKKIREKTCKAVILQVANPMPAIIYFFNKLGWFAPDQLVGVGDIVDIGRIEQLFHKAFPDWAVTITVIGLVQHGSGIIVPRNSIRIDGRTIEEFAEMAGGDVAVNIDKIEDIFKKVGNVAVVYRHETRQTPYHSPAAAVALLVQALFDPLHYYPMCVVVIAPKDIADLGIEKGMALVWQVGVGKGRIRQEFVEVKLSPDEKDALRSTMRELKEEYDAAELFLAELKRVKKI